MRTLLLGTDFMYDMDGNLKPIEINTNTGWDGFQKVETNEDALDLSQLVSFINEKQFTKIDYIGNIMPFYSRLTGSTNIPCELHITNNKSITVPNIPDSDTTLIIRSSYDTTALIDDTYCRDKINYLDLIKSKPFGHEFAYINTNGNLINSITTILNNGNHPNFILKYRYPNYDKNVYPKLFKVNNQEDLDVVLKSIPVDYFLMPFYYNSDKLFNNHIRIIRSLNLILPPDLNSIELGCYNKLSSNEINDDSVYDTNTFELTNIDDKARYLTSYNIGNKPKLEDSDLVEMADGTFKTATDLQVGDIIKTIDIPNPFNVSNANDVANYKIDFNTLVSGTTYSTNSVIKKVRVNFMNTIVNINFTDGDTWLDTSSSKYLLDRSNEIRFLPAWDIQSGDKMVLIDTSNQITPNFIEKTVSSISIDNTFFGGWIITIENVHLFLTKSSSNTSTSYVSIEHNDFLCSNVCTWNDTDECPKNLPNCSCGGDCTSGNPYSDIRLKRNIKYIGVSPLGIKIYQFKYKKPEIYGEGTFIGVMAQDLLNTNFSNAIKMNDNGYYSVDYTKLDVEFKKIK